VFTALFIAGKIMLRAICLFSIVLVASCTGIRNRSTYNMELIYIEQGLTRQGDIVKEYIKSTCCQGGHYQDSIDCYAALDTYITIKERTKYHLDMMRYLGRFTDDRPELPEIIIEGDLVCE
jgi:hypothetical protein